MVFCERSQIPIFLDLILFWNTDSKTMHNQGYNGRQKNVKKAKKVQF